MKIKLHPEIIQKFPGINYAVLVIKDMPNEKRNSSLMQLLRGVCAVKKNELKKNDNKQKFELAISETLKEDSVLLESYLLESRVKKVLKGKELLTDDNLSDCLLYLSMKFLIPIFALDLDELDKDYQIAFYKPKKGKKAPEPLLNRQTKNIVVWIANLRTLDSEQFEAMIKEFQTILSKYCHATLADCFLLDDTAREADLGYVSAKEIEYQEKVQAEEAEKAEQAARQAAEKEEALQEASLQNETSNAVIDAQTPSAISSADFVKNPSIKESLSLLISDALEKFLSELTDSIAENHDAAKFELMEVPEVEVPKDATYGDYSSNIAMKLAKKLKMNPLELAEKIKQKIIPVTYLETVEIKPPGFINFKLSTEYCSHELKKLLQLKEKSGSFNVGKGEKVMIEFGSLNIAKPFGAHHFLTTVIGQSLVNIYRALGYKVLAADYPGDWGTQFGKLMYAYKNWSNKEEIEKEPMDELLKLYIRFHDEAEKDPALEDKAREEFKKLEEKDPENLKLWEWMRDLSIKDIETIYKTLGVHHDRVYPESKYLESCHEILAEGKAKGIFIQGEKGAYIVDLEAEGLPPYLVQKADGTTLYATRDLASIKDRNQEAGLKKIIYVVDVAQSLHFKQLFASAKKLNLTKAELIHVYYGRMRMPDASMSTRKGNIILGKDLIKEAVAKVLATVKEKSPELPLDEQNIIAQGAGIGAIKYAMICQNPESDFTFEWDKVLSFDGNSAPYLQYTQARANSILKKAHEHYHQQKAGKTSAIQNEQVSLFSLDAVRDAQEEESVNPFENKHELELLKFLIKFPEALEAAAYNYKPNLFTQYLFELAQAFNAFYHAVPVLKTQKADLLEARLNLVQGTSQTLKNGLTILGIQTFERM